MKKTQKLSPQQPQKFLELKNEICQAADLCCNFDKENEHGPMDRFSEDEIFVDSIGHFWISSFKFSGISPKLYFLQIYISKSTKY